MSECWTSVISRGTKHRFRGWPGWPLIMEGVPDGGECGEGKGDRAGDVRRGEAVRQGLDHAAWQGRTADPGRAGHPYRLHLVGHRARRGRRPEGPDH